MFTRRSPVRRAPKGWTKPPRRFPVLPATPPAIVGVMLPAVFTEASPKAEPVRSRPYLKLVASLACWRCGIERHSQAAHSDEGKGLAIKACDLTCYPACGPHDGERGCHYIIGSTGTYTREERRALERQAGEDTRDALRALAVTDRKARHVLVRVGLLEKGTQA